MPLPPPGPYYRGDTSELAVSGRTVALTAAISNTLPVNLASATPNLPVMLRGVVCLTAGTIGLQPPSGPSFSLAMQAGQVFDSMFVAAVSVPNDTSFVGLV